MTEHASIILDSCARSIYGLRHLRARGMSDDCLQEVFRSTVLAKLQLCKPSLVRFLLRKRRQRTQSIDFSTGANVSSTAVTILDASLNILTKLIILSSKLLTDRHHDRSYQYTLRPRYHNLTWLSCKSSFYDFFNFITNAFQRGISTQPLFVCKLLLTVLFILCAARYVIVY